MKDADSTNCATSSATRWLSLAGLHARRAGGSRRRDATCHRQPRPGGVSGRHVRRPLRRVRRLPDPRRSPVPGRRHQARPLANRDRAATAGGLCRCAGSLGRSGGCRRRARTRRRHDRALPRRRAHPGLPVPACAFTAIAGRPLHRGHRGALGRRTRAGVLPLSAVHRAAARQRRSATGRRDASPPARQAP